MGQTGSPALDPHIHGKLVDDRAGSAGQWGERIGNSINGAKAIFILMVKKENGSPLGVRCIKQFQMD